MKRAIGLLLVPFLLLGGLQVSALEKKDRLWQDETIYYILVDRFLNGDENNDYEVDLQNFDAYYGRGWCHKRKKYNKIPRQLGMSEGGPQR